MTTTNVSPARLATGPARVGGDEVSFASVVHINEKGGSFGGTEEYIALVTAALSTHGVRSTLVCGVVAGVLPADLDGVRLVPGLASREPQAGTAAAVAAVVAELEPDVIYVHNVFDATIVPTLAALVPRGVLLWYVHDHYLTCLTELRWRRDLGSCPQRLGPDCVTAIRDGHCVQRHRDQVHVGADVPRRRALSRSLGAADAVIVVSDYMRTLLDAAEPRLGGDLHVLSRPIRELGPLVSRPRAASSETAVVTYAGRINAEKGLDVVIEALGATPSTMPVELRVAGVVEDGAYWARCEGLIATALARNAGLRVVSLGHLGYEATDELFRRSDIVTIPSRWPEPLGAVALEAMSAGAAVVVAPVGGLGDIIVPGRNGLHAAAGDVASWTTALTVLLERPDHARRLGRRGHRDVTRNTTVAHLRELDDLVVAHRTDWPRAS